MKVGLSATVIQGGRSGVGQYIFSIVRELIHFPNIDLHIFALEHETPLFDFARDHCKIIPVDAWASSPIKNIWWHHRTAPSIAKDLQLDIFHVPSYRRLMSSRQFATVGTIHDLAPFHVKGKYDIARMFYGKVIVKQLAKKQTKIVAVSHDTAKDIEHFFNIPRQEITVIHNGIDHERFQSGDKQSAQQWMHDHHGIETPYFVYISRLEHPAKNHVRLIEAFSAFKKETNSTWQLVIGGGDWHGSEEIYMAAKASDYADEIRFLGFIPDENLSTIYQAASCLVYPSLFEGFGLPPIEAMACGLPVISSHKGALKEVVADSGIIINPESVEDIKQALIKVENDPQLLSTLVVKAQKNADRFHWKLAAQQLVDVYQSAMAQHRKQLV